MWSQKIDKMLPALLEVPAFRIESLVTSGGKTFKPTRIPLEDGSIYCSFSLLKDDGGVRSNGEFHLYSLDADQLINDHSNPTHLWEPIEELYNDSELNILKNARIIEDHPQYGDSVLVLFSPGETHTDDSIYFYDRGALYKLELSLDEYADALRDLKGIFYWQLLFADFQPEFGEDSFSGRAYLNCSNPRRYLETMSACLEALSELFPEADYSGYQGRLETLSGNANFLKK